MIKWRAKGDEMIQMPGVGPARQKALAAAGIHRMEDLLYRFPVDFHDYSDLRPIASLRPGMRAAFRGEVLRRPKRNFVRGLSLVTVRIADGTGEIECVWFNQPYMATQITDRQSILCYASIQEKRGVLQAVNPILPSREEAGKGLVPVYAPVAGVPQRLYRELTDAALLQAGDKLTDELPEEFAKRYDLIPLKEAVFSAHHPQDATALERARRRLSFEELFLYQLALWEQRATPRPGVAVPCGFDQAAPLLDAMPFALTNAQDRVMQEIYGDLEKNTAMARLVQGDVGSGKTALAYLALYAVCRAGYQGALMAPTEILAGQHYEGAMELLAPLGLSVDLITGGLTAKERRLAHERLASGETQIAIGTHALISDGVEYSNLGLVITDEQHRFGVRQRTVLQEKGQAPNVLVMSATPIPRTLALILYGDLDISVVDELPPGRTPVSTHVVPENKREDMMGFLAKQMEEGGQVYVVCPLVEESEAVEAVSAQQRYEELSARFASFGVGLVHGRQRAQEKARMLECFAKGELGMLVSTTVIEVGVNVPNANVMVIEGADRFGLAQLHQLRGRVGRGKRVSYCFLLGKSERLRILASTNDGFVIAQKDLEQRGPGELLGTRQHGAIDGRLAALAADSMLLSQANQAAREILEHPDTPHAQALIGLAQRRYALRMQDLARN